MPFKVSIAIPVHHRGFHLLQFSGHRALRYGIVVSYQNQQMLGGTVSVSAAVTSNLFYVEYY